MFKNFNLASIISIIIIGLFVGVVFVYADWSAPISSPPTCVSGDPGCDTPINVSNNTQTLNSSKTIRTKHTDGTIDAGAINIMGALGINGFIDVLSDSFFRSNLTVGGTLTSQGQNVCLKNGIDCPVSGVGGGGGTVTSVRALTGLISNPDPITMTGTISLNLASLNTWTAAQTFSGGANFPSGVWNTSGNVGIGTASPSSNLTVAKSSVPDIAIFQSGVSTGAVGNNGKLKFSTRRSVDQAETTVGYIQGITENAASLNGFGGMRFVATNNSDVEAMRIISNGNVGIGTINPGAKLEVVGNTILNGRTNFGAGTVRLYKCPAKRAIGSSVSICIGQLGTESSCYAYDIASSPGTYSTYSCTATNLYIE